MDAVVSQYTGRNPVFLWRCITRLFAATGHRNSKSRSLVKHMQDQSKGTGRAALSKRSCIGAQYGSETATNPSWISRTQVIREQLSARIYKLKLWVRSGSNKSPKRYLGL